MQWIDLIKRYIPYNNQEKKDKEMILDCINRFHDILYRNNELVHITSSAFVVNATRDKVLVVHHNIYNSWSWTGGHADGEEDLLAIKLATEMGYKDNFMGYKTDQVKFVGHGIDLGLDEWPIFAKGIKIPILPGMTFALEPKLVFHEGAIGTENSFVMTEDGPQYLSITPDIITYITK